MAVCAVKYKNICFPIVHYTSFSDTLHFFAVFFFMQFVFFCFKSEFLSFSVVHKYKKNTYTLQQGGEMLMMNYIWCAAVLGSIVYSFFCGNAPQTVNAGITAASDCITSTLALAGMICMWSGIMKIAEQSGMSAVISRLLTPVTRRLFPRLNSDSAAVTNITMNITANLLGMGNAATPLGLKAMECLDRENGGSEYASDEMCIFTVLNTASFQLVPTTVISLRAAAGSQNPYEIILPIWLVSLFSLTAALISVKIMLKIKGGQCRGGNQ